MTRKDFFTSLVLIVFGLAVVAESLRMPRFESLGINPYTVPGLVPGVLGGVIVLLGMVMLLRSSLAGGWRRVDTSSELAPSPLAREGTRRLALTLFLTLGYAGVLVGRLPFWLATLTFVFLFITLFEWRRSYVISQKLSIIGFALLQAALVAVAVTYVFERIFLVRLP